MTLRRRTAWHLSLGSLLAVLPIVARADPPEMKPADAMTVSPGGVDLRTGRYTINEQDLAIGGESPGALEFKRTTPNQGPSKFDHNWGIALKQYRACNLCTGVSDVSVSVQGVSYSFYDSSQPELKLVSNADFAKLVRTMVGTTQNYYTLTTADGTIAVFSTIPYPGPMTGWAPAVPLTITRPNGVVLTFVYSTAGLVSVTSNAGYRLILEYGSGAVTKACVVNLTTTTASTSCPTGAQTVTYTISSGYLTSLTDRGGATWNFSTTTTSLDDPVQQKFYRPGETTPYLTNNWGKSVADNAVVLSQDFADGRHIDYAYHAETNAVHQISGEQVHRDMHVGDGWTVNGTQTTAVTFGSNGAIPPVITPTPVSITDPLNRQTTWAYPPTNQWAGGARALSRTSPEGNSEAYSYDAYRNLTQIDRAPKPGSGLAHITTSATFDNCSNAGLVACNKPTATIDANGKQTDYTYDPVHGGLLTETLPADSTGIRAQKRYSYVQRSAWISNGGGGFVSAGPPIWLLDQVRTCRTTATVGDACAGGSADEVVTTNDYGPNTGAVGNNLLLRGVAVTADGQTLRTCYGYDTNGNRIWETKPRAGLPSCS